MNIDEKHSIYRTANHNPDKCDVCNQRAIKVRSFLNKLEIPIVTSTTQTGGLSINICVRGYELYDILTDENKLKVLISKLRNKAFW